MIRQRPAAADAPSPVIRESRRTATHGTPALAPRLTRARGPERPLRLAGVYDEIKDRQGHLRDGIFIKAEEAPGLPHGVAA